MVPYEERFRWAARRTWRPRARSAPSAHGGLRGPDDAGRRIRETLAALDGGPIHPRLVERPTRPTTTKTRVVARSQQVVRFDREHADDLPDDCADELCAAVRAAVAASDALVLEDYNKGVLVPSVIRAALDAAAEAGIPSVVDPKFRNFMAFGGATVFKPNALELGAALGSHVRPDDDAWLEDARARVDAEHLLLTLGEDGMALRSGRAHLPHPHRGARGCST